MITKIKWKCLIVMIGVIGLFVLISNQVFFGKKVDCVSELTPFEIHIDTPQFVKEDEDVRMVLKVDISNKTDMEFDDVWFEIMMNQEVEPYIATHIISYKSEPMDVTTQKNAISLEATKEKPNISGFTHNWDMLLTTEADLKEFYNLSPDGIMDSLKYIQVIVHWDQKYCQSYKKKVELSHM